MNPCDECLVQAACSELCEDKLAYQLNLNWALESLSPHLYSQNGHRRKHIPQHTIKQRDAIMKKLDRNRVDLRKIISHKKVNY